MNTKLVRIATVALVAIVLMGAVLGTMYVLDVLTLPELKDAMTKVAAVVSIAVLTAAFVLVAVSFGKKEE